MDKIFNDLLRFLCRYKGTLNIKAEKLTQKELFRIANDAFSRRPSSKTLRRFSGQQFESFFNTGPSNTRTGMLCIQSKYRVDWEIQTWSNFSLFDDSLKSTEPSRFIIFAYKLICVRGDVTSRYNDTVMDMCQHVLCKYQVVRDPLIYHILRPLCIGMHIKHV